jgi:hypothetical protein
MPPPHSAGTPFQKDLVDLFLFIFLDRILLSIFFHFDFASSQQGLKAEPMPAPIDLHITGKNRMDIHWSCHCAATTVFTCERDSALIQSLLRNDLSELSSTSTSTRG